MGKKSRFLLEEEDVTIIERGPWNPTPEELNEAQRVFNSIIKNPVPYKD